MTPAQEPAVVYADATLLVVDSCRVYRTPMAMVRATFASVFGSREAAGAAA